VLPKLLLGSPVGITGQTLPCPEPPPAHSVSATWVPEGPIWSGSSVPSCQSAISALMFCSMGLGKSRGKMSSLYHIPEPMSTIVHLIAEMAAIPTPFSSKNGLMFRWILYVRAT
jgi:hypothetical protein